MIFSLSLGFLMGKDIHCLPCTNFFIKCSVCIISFDSYHKPMRSWDCPHFSRGPWPPSNSPLWPVRPVLLGFCTAGSERKGEGEKGGVWGSSLVDSIGECGKDGQLQYARGEAGEKGKISEAARWSMNLLQTAWETSGLNLAYFEIIFRLVDCVSLSETLPRDWTTWVMAVVVWKANYTPVFQRKFKIELEHGDETALSLVGFGLLMGLAWVSKVASGAELSAQSLWLPLSFPPLFLFFLYAHSSSLSPYAMMMNCIFLSEKQGLDYLRRWLVP